MNRISIIAESATIDDRSRRLHLIVCLVLVAGFVHPCGTSIATAQEVETATPAETDEESPDAAADAAPMESTPAPPLSPPPVNAEIDPGQADLDEAVLKRIDAESNGDLEAVAALIESALAKGLSEENDTFARKMLGSVQLQRGQGLAGAMVRLRGRQQLLARTEATRALQDAIDNDPDLAEAHMLIAQLNLLPDGDTDVIRESTTAAIGLYADNPIEQSKAYLLRAVTQEDADKKLADLNAAIEANPGNADALRQRAGAQLQAGDVERAVEDLQRVLELDPTNQQIAQETVQQLVDLDRADDAVALLSKAIAASPSEGLYRLRAILYRMLEKEDEAFADLNKALAMQPKDPLALLQRAELALGRDDVKSAKQDLKSATEIAPQVEQIDQAIVVRCFIAIEEGRMADAISDMQILIERNPNDTFRQLQLASLYLQDDRPRQAIETLTSVLEKEPGNSAVLRSRADAYLAVGEHSEAIADYERALDEIGDQDDEENTAILSGILNNLAWVLATSPQDDVRDGQRAVELGERAVELTDESEAHVLSTLAAGYAESGDFDKAIQWSKKAVEQGQKEENDQIDQLEQELESYRKNEPWREKQETEENQLPILSPEDLIDT
ncbi:tetratricopeptide repeat protein [Allorhodopirellula solitaria]|uniref:Tetratricopeptide repeat protein n=1 Tax=Allorhodopirellula solitaria TaxID=2527987 RepID=A0A5C5YI39_9BACT|nr:tetratricopeptide repeat protein [Allorhodopirellula solitaria]TWT74232.1 tetratricopeptide repeat protein [Allorhodopirellula solitaria]